MNSEPPQDPPQPPEAGNVPVPPADPSGSVISQSVNYSHVSARVPERVGRGTFATNALVLAGPQEVVLDFLLRLVPPYQLAGRVIIPRSALASVVTAVQENLNNFRARFPSTPSLPPPPPNVKPPSIQDIYDQLKISEEVIAGAYANRLMITHGVTEFCFDFILDVFPRPTVTSRIYLAAPQVPPFLEALKRTLVQIQSRAQRVVAPPNPQPTPPAAPGAAEGPATDGG